MSKDAINDKRRIIITTLHRFPLIYKELDNHKGKRFAIIVDEAHSSQSGKSAEKLKAALADTDEALKEMADPIVLAVVPADKSALKLSENRFQRLIGGPDQ